MQNVGNMDPVDQRRARLDRRNEARRARLAAESQEQAQIRKRLNAEVERQRRLKETENESQQRKQADAEATKRLRKSETDEETKQRREFDASARKTARENESAEQSQQRREAHAQAERIRLQQEAEEQHKQRFYNDAISHAITRARLIQGQNISHEYIPFNAEYHEHLVDEQYCGPMSVKCVHCSALHFGAEKAERDPIGIFSQCCEKGNVKLPPLSDFPELFENLMTNRHPESKNFLENIRSYNSSFAFASMGATLKSPPGNGPYCFRIQGQVYHRTGMLHPEGELNRTFAQLYVLDPEEATAMRMSNPANEQCHRDLMSSIQQVMSETPFARAYKMMFEVEKEAKEDAIRRGVEISEVQMLIKQDRNQIKQNPVHAGRLNIPTVNEVAIVFQSEDGVPHENRDLLIHCRHDPSNPNSIKLKRLDVMHKNLEPMTYPLFYPSGEQGWGPLEKLVGKGQRTTMSLAEFYGYRLSVRDEFNPILNGGKLTQQYIVDCYVRLEANNLNWLRYNQAKLRAENYGELIGHLNNNNYENGPPGTRVILPSTFEGSPRNYQQRYQDAMATVTKCGKPDLFITMTCNPNWKEIQDNLKPWQKAEHRPDLVARVFNLKLKSLMLDIKVFNIFGKVEAYLYVIEFQKRGLPHAHILITLEKDSKLKTEADIDKVVKAEIPDKEISPRLFDIVTKQMVHGPCGKENPKSPCMLNHKCSKNFPKDFESMTRRTEDGYPKYKRRNTGKFQIGNRLIDNSWIVPYNAFLLLKYDCHINVETCASIKGVKYMFKYVYKGYDCASIEIKEKTGNNEINKFVESRYISAPEAMWRIFKMKMHDQYHVITRLAVHLPNAQQIFFDEDALENPDEVAMKAAMKITTLMAWFKLNESDLTARQYLYREIPEHYTVDKDTKLWKVRSRGGDKTIGRMYGATMKDPERYFLRLLLLHVRGATSFDDLRTVNGELCETFKEAARRRGLLEDDTVWQETLQDAAVYKMPSQLRDIFVYICVFGCPAQPLLLWNTFKSDLMEDFCQSHGDDECRYCEEYALQEVKATLGLLKKKLSDFNLREPVANLPPLNIQRYDESAEHELCVFMADSLNEEQRFAFEEIKGAIDSRRQIPRCFFLDGPGGSGKTYLYSTIMHFLRSRGKVVLPSASTGIAANLLEGGRTVHSLFKLPNKLNDISVSYMKSSDKDWETIKKADLLIVDECTMVSKYALDCINRLLKEVMQGDIEFGGKVLVFGGDFRQCIAIVPKAQRALIVEACLKRSQNWHNFTMLTLVNNMRSEDSEYSDWLLKLGDGTLETFPQLGNDMIEIPEQFVCSNCIITEIFGENIAIEDVPLLAKRAILSPKNIDVKQMNEKIMNLIPGDYRIYLSNDFLKSDNSSDVETYPTEFLNTLLPSGFPFHELKLKNGVIVILVRNLNTSRGLCNGTRLIVREMQPNLIVADVLTGSAEGQRVLIPRIDLETTDADLPFTMVRRQFPLKPAFAMTINKSQGQTLKKVGIYLPEPCFGHGQLYVAFSRARRACDVKVKVLNTSFQGQLLENSARVFTSNVVYQEVLQ